MTPSNEERLAILETEHHAMKDAMLDLAVTQKGQAATLNTICVNLATLNSNVNTIVEERREQGSRWKDPMLYITMISVVTAIYAVMPNK